MIQKRSRKWFTNSFAALSLLLASSSAMAGQAPLTGAIFTTTELGIPVNNNIYDNKEDVYLNGGPQPNRKCDAAGLPDGDYYFQVTDPAGKVLLSLPLDPPLASKPPKLIDERGVRVIKGVFVDSNITFHSVAQDDPNITPGRCGGYNVQLAPFANTPNPGGEYKVWITRVGDYDETATLGSFGFIPSKSKTDNFKVVNPAAPDSDGDGIPESDDLCPDMFDPTNQCLPPPPM